MFIVSLLPHTIHAQTNAPTGSGNSINFTDNISNDYDYGLMTDIPAGFGSGEFTFELWVRLNNSYQTGSTFDNVNDLINWSTNDEEPYSTNSWWYPGNFLLDGHNHGIFHYGTFSLQLYGGGRVRWLFGDGQLVERGGPWGIGAHPANTTPSLLDDEWHQITLVRRWKDTTQSALELWIDGGLVDTQTSPLRTDMRKWWDTWSAFPTNQAGWFFGTQKQVAVGVLSTYEDYKGLIDEMRFWNRAKSASEIENNYNLSVNGSELGLSGWYDFKEGSSTQVCNRQSGGDCMTLIDMKAGYWDSRDAPLLSTTSTPIVSDENTASRDSVSGESSSPSSKFTRNLHFGLKGDDVKHLQEFLNQQGFVVSLIGAGSKNNETTYFGPRTLQALIQFQNFYRDDILAPVGLSAGSGYFGPFTLKKVRQITGEF